MIEEWRPCFGGFYEASDMGSVRRAVPWSRPMPNGGRYTHRPSGVLRPQRRRKDGRMYVSVYNESGRKVRGVHQLVAEAFLGLRPAGLEVNHKNGDKLDNRAANLEYVTAAENSAHAHRLGLLRGPGNPARGERNAKAKLTADDVVAIRRRYAAGEHYKAIASEFGIGKSNLYYIVGRAHWRHVP